MADYNLSDRFLISENEDGSLHWKSYGVGDSKKGGLCSFIAECWIKEDILFLTALKAKDRFGDGYTLDSAYNRLDELPKWNKTKYFMIRNDSGDDEIFYCESGEVLPFAEAYFKKELFHFIRCTFNIKDWNQQDPIKLNSNKEKTMNTKELSQNQREILAAELNKLDTHFRDKFEKFTDYIYNFVDLAKLIYQIQIELDNFCKDFIFVDHQIKPEGITDENIPNVNLLGIHRFLFELIEEFDYYIKPSLDLSACAHEFSIFFEDLLAKLEQ